MEIIQESHRVECVSYSHEFRYLNDPGAGFAFECTEDGEVLNLLDRPAAAENYQKCLNGTHPVRDMGITKREWSYTAPRIGRCDCGCAVVLDRFTNTCDDCGTDYNMGGQALAPRSQWGEETGESYCDLQDL